MAQFQVYRITGGRFVLDLQTDLIETGTRVVAPLVPVALGPKAIGRLEPVFDIEGAAQCFIRQRWLPSHRAYSKPRPS